MATVRSDTTEIETCRNELTDQHRTLTLIARTLNSTRSSKRAKETGVLEARLQEQLHALEVRFSTLVIFCEYLEASFDSGQKIQGYRFGSQFQGFRFFCLSSIHK